MPDGQSITPTAAPGAIFISLNPGLADYPDFTAGQAVTSAVSPDGRTLLVLTSGYNRNNDGNGKIIPRDSNEYLFIFDITSGTPVKKEVIQVPRVRYLAAQPSERSLVKIAFNKTKLRRAKQKDQEEME